MVEDWNKQIKILQEQEKNEYLARRGRREGRKRGKK